MKTLTKIKFCIDKFMEWSCIVLLAVMTCLVTYQVFTRKVLDSPSPFSEILAQYLFVWMVMFGSAYVFGMRDHLNITLIKDKMSPRAEMITEIAIAVMLIGFAGGVCAIGGGMQCGIQMGTIDAALKIPMGVIYSSLLICGVTMCFYAVYNIFRAIDVFKNHPDCGPKKDSAGTM